MQNDPKKPIAEPAPVPTVKRIPRLVWIGGVIGAALLACTVCAVVGVGGWWLGSGRAPVGNDGAKGLVPLMGKNGEARTFQELQDHLASKGMKTSRGMCERGMLFVPGDGTPLDANSGAILECEEIGPQEGQFLVKDFGSANAATAEAARNKDVDQRDVLAWNRFVFYEGASKGSLAKLRKALLGVTEPVLKKEPPGALRVKANYEKPGNSAKIGVGTSLIVHVERIGCKGGVTVGLRGLPAGLTASPLVIPAESDRGRISLAVANGTLPAIVEIRIAAEIENAAIRDEAPLTLIIK